MITTTMKNHFLTLLLFCLVFTACKKKKEVALEDYVPTELETEALALNVSSLQSAASPEAYSIAFYNVENLFNTKDDSDAKDEEFTPTGKKKWTAQRYEDKLKRLGKVMQELGDADGPELLGLCEVENADALQDLLEVGGLAEKGYAAIHTDSPDPRGIDVCVLYKTGIFKPTKAEKVYVRYPNSGRRTRDVLHVEGTLRGEQVHLFVVHFKSRGGGQLRTEPKRMYASRVVRLAANEILKKDPKANIAIMGDFNDTPKDNSLTIGLEAVKKPDYTHKQLLNPFYTFAEKGEGTYNYKGQWNCLDQILLSEGFTDDRGAIRFEKAGIFKPSYIQKEGKPYRTFSRDEYIGGYSDHFPIYINLTTP